MIVILGCDHCLQQLKSQSPFWSGVDQTKRARCQREGFLETLETALGEYGCTLIGEETIHGQATPAADLAQRLRLKYRNIDMTASERAAAGIPSDSEYGDGYSAEQKEQWYRQREQHMAEEIEKTRSGKENVLIVCGATHMVPLESYFRNKGEEVVTCDLRQAPWFSGPLSTEWLDEG
jgi:hypothetical protein